MVQSVFSENIVRVFTVTYENPHFFKGREILEQG